jgi:cell division protein ZapE
VDYRLRALEQASVYHVPADATADAAMARTFDAVATGPDEPPELAIEARVLRARRRAGAAVWFDFATLCGGPRSHADYLEIAAQFHTVLLSNVPCMSAGQASEARRFTWLVDVLYDHRVKLLASAEAPPDQLYTSGVLSNEFARTASRLVEMQSREYLDAPRRDVVQRV